MRISEAFSMSPSDETIYASTRDPKVTTEALHTYLITNGQKRHFTWDWEFVRNYSMFYRRTTPKGVYTTTRIGPLRYIKHNR